MSKHGRRAKSSRPKTKPSSAAAASAALSPSHSVAPASSSVTAAAAAEPPSHSNTHQLQLQHHSTTTTTINHHSHDEMTLSLTATPRRFQLLPETLHALLPPYKNALKELGFQAVSPALPPSFTTPSLDFAHFAKDIGGHVDSIQSFVDGYYEENPVVGNTNLSEYEKTKNLRVVLRVRDAISFFNAFTCPPLVVTTRNLSLPSAKPVKTTNNSASSSPSSSSSASSSSSSSSSSSPQQQDPASSFEHNIYPAKIIVCIASSISPLHSTAATPPETPVRKSSSLPTRRSSPVPFMSAAGIATHPYHELISSLNSTHPSFDITLSGTARAQYHFLRAALYAFLPWKDERVAEDLGRCLKLDPKRVDAWNLMGEWYCRQGGNPDDKKDWWKLGRQCFENGLKVKRNRDGLLFLAQVLRAGVPNKENMETSQTMCQEALDMDQNDGKSWFGIGCVHLKRFFGLTFHLPDLHLALTAYNHATQDPKMARDPDLYGNRASVYQYTESYHAALEDFRLCCVLDPCGSGVEVGPTVDALKGTLGGVSRSIAVCLSEVKAGKHGKRKGTAFANPFKKMREVEDVHEVVCGDDVDFIQREEVHVGKYLKVEVLRCLGDGLPRTFVAKDERGVCMGVSVFNIAVPIHVGDEIVIANPVVFRVKVDFEDCKVDYINLRIDRPWLLSVNGRLVGKQGVALTEARFENL